MTQEHIEDTTRYQNPFIIGERLYLRPLEPAQDNHLYSTWLNDAEIRRYFSIYPTSDTRAKERIDNLYKSTGHIIFGVVLKEDNRLIGLVGLKDINLLNQSAEFYVIIGERRDAADRRCLSESRWFPLTPRPPLPRRGEGRRTVHPLPAAGRLAE